MPDLNFDETIILENELARIEPLDLKHFSALAHIAQQNADLMKYSPQNITPDEELEKYINKALLERKNKERYAFVIFDKNHNEIAGSTSFGSVSNIDERVEIGWTWIGRKYQGTGLNKAVKNLLLQYAFENLQFKRVEFRVHSENMRSRKAVEKIGGTYEGTLRSHTAMGGGTRRHTVYFSILQEEWPEIKATVFR